MADLIPLSQRLYPSNQQTIAFAKGIASSHQAFEASVSQWMTVLKPHKGNRWAVYHHDAFEFIAIVFALWQLRRCACVPGDNLAGTVQRLRSRVDGFVGEFDLDETLMRDDSSNGLALGHEWSVVDTDLAGLEVYTSGSTGEPIAIVKTIKQLELEVQALESLWPSQADGVVLSTVSHQHLYGMTFRLFWPLSVSRPFERETIEYTEDIFYLARIYPAYCLVASPSHLARLNTSVNWHELGDRCQYVLSSAAPLQRIDSLNVAQLLSTEIREIYGSSETGALAWRSQCGADTDATWQALPSVHATANNDGRLVVKAAYLGGSDEMVMADGAQFIDDYRFSLTGRTDRVVKVEGKRVSLEAIERLLVEHDYVESARALILERRRVETVVVLELTERGKSAHEAGSVKQLTKQLREILSQHFEAVVLPRRWRIVERMPYNPQGKLPLATLQQLFQPTSVLWPEITSSKTLDGQLTMACFIPAALSYFEGHFPENPILPGIVQVHWAEAYGRQHLAMDGIFDRLEAVKFQQIITPTLTVTLTLRYDRAKAKLHFTYTSAKGTHSSGRICFR